MRSDLIEVTGRCFDAGSAGPCRADRVEATVSASDDRKETTTAEAACSRDGGEKVEEGAGLLWLVTPADEGRRVANRQRPRVYPEQYTAPVGAGGVAAVGQPHVGLPAPHRRHHRPRIVHQGNP